MIAAIGSLVATFYLSYSGGLDCRDRPSKSTPLPKSSLCFFWFFILAPFRFCQKQWIFLSLIHCISISFTSETQNPSSLSLSHSYSPLQTQNPTQTLFIFKTLSLSLALSLPYTPKIPMHLVSATQQPQSTLSSPPHLTPKIPNALSGVVSNTLSVYLFIFISALVCNFQMCIGLLMKKNFQIFFLVLVCVWLLRKWQKGKENQREISSVQISLHACTV